MNRPTLQELAEKYGLQGIHPAAQTFPMMTDEEHASLVKDVIEHGFSTQIVATSDGWLLDGRNRMLASWDTQLDVGIRRYDPPSPMQWVLSENLERRHLTPGQRAAVAVDVLPIFEEEALQRQRQAGHEHGRGINEKLGADLPQAIANDPAALTSTLKPDKRAPRARDKAAAATGAAGRSVAQAKRVKEAAPDLFEDVRSGKIALDAAHKEVKRRTAAQPKPDPDPKPSTETLILVTHDGTEIPYPKPKAKPTFNETNDHISWADWSWNPVTGCLHECTYCYAREIANLPSYKHSYPVGFTPLYHRERLGAPANTKVPNDAGNTPAGRVFVCSMADLYGKWVPDQWINEIHQTMIDNPQWEYLLLTKFPSRYNKLTMPESAWAGTSVDSQRRVPVAEAAFREINNVRVKWLSLEPLLEPLKFNDLSMFDWVVIGSQTQTVQPGGVVVPAVAPCFEWVTYIVAQAREAGCKVFLKPNLLGATGPQNPGMILPREEPTTERTR